MHPWFVWIYWINPLAYGYEAVSANEFHDTIIPCVGLNLIPNGPGYANSSFQSCAGVGGAVQGTTFATGDAYLGSLSYSHSNVWRNFGIIWVRRAPPYEYIQDADKIKGLVGILRWSHYMVHLSLARAFWE